MWILDRNRGKSPWPAVTQSRSHQSVHGTNSRIAPTAWPTSRATPTRGGIPGISGVWRLDPKEPNRLATALDRNFSVPAPAIAPAGPQWLEDGSFRAAIEDRATVRIVVVHPDGSWDDVVGGQRLITGMTTRRDGSAMAMISVGPTDPGELVWWENGIERTLTELNTDFRSTAGLVDLQHFTVDHDGTQLDAWILLPPGTGKVPLLLNMHGGPATQYGFGFFDEFQIYVSAGFGVVACNPRGSSGRGTDFVRAPVGRWAEERPPDLEDILAVVDASLERFDRLDADRMGIMGGLVRRIHDRTHPSARSPVEVKQCPSAVCTHGPRLPERPTSDSGFPATTSAIGPTTTGTPCGPPVRSPERTRSPHRACSFIPKTTSGAPSNRPSSSLRCSSNAVSRRRCCAFPAAVMNCRDPANPSTGGSGLRRSSTGIDAISV